jgi:lysophospholipase L1-like esterase
MHNYSYLALGDSYTIGEGVSTKDSFPYQLQSMLEPKMNTNVDIQMVAKTGWTCQELYEEICRTPLKTNYDFITLCIGVNNQYRGCSLNQYYKEIYQLYNFILKKVKSPSTIFVLTIPDYSTTPFVKSNQELVRAQIDLFNTMNQYVLKGSTIIDITEMSAESFKSELMLVADELHPSKLVYEKWASLLLPEVLKRLI